ncbi:sensor histidine kinase [Streptomyces globisporus]|uniref:ATP-binding protein n=1 Tax=Streptomyces globisporus TaxID=1908 RepID=UPI00367A4C7F
MLIYVVYAALGLAVLAAAVFGILLRRARAQAVRAKADAQAERQTMEATAHTLRKAADQAQTQAARAEQHSRAVVAEVRHLAAVRLPAVIEGLRRPGVTVPGMTDERLLAGPVDRACEQVLAVVTDAVTEDRIRTDESAQEVVRSVMGTTRALAAQAVQLVEQAQYKAANAPDLLEDLYGIDHRLVLLHRQVQRTAVVCGDLPGTAREDTTIMAALETARSRIVKHQRVSAVSHVPAEPDGRDLGLQAPVAEPLIMVLAELFDNAVYCSVGSGLVSAEAHPTATGVLITITDSGPGLDTVEKQLFVRQMLESSRLLLRDAGSPPRLGLAAVGRLVSRFEGLTLTLDPSPARGLRVSLHIDASLLVPVSGRQRPERSGVRLDPLPQPEPAIAQAPQLQQPAGPSRTALPTRDGFPQRQRKSPGAPVDHEPEPLPLRDAAAVRSAYASLQSGTQRARQEPSPHTDHPSDSASWES